MSEKTELKNCPFCGESVERAQLDPESIQHRCKSLETWYSAILLPVELWNRRPIEDALEVELGQALNEVEHVKELRARMKMLENMLMRVAELSDDYQDYFNRIEKYNVTGWGLHMQGERQFYDLYHDLMQIVERPK